MKQKIKKVLLILCLFMAFSLLSACAPPPNQALTGTFHNHRALKDENSHTEFNLTPYGEVIFSYSYVTDKAQNAYNSFGPVGTFLDHNGKIVFNFDTGGYQITREGESTAPDANQIKETYSDILPTGRIVRYTIIKNDILYLYDNNGYRNTLDPLLTGPFHKGTLKECTIDLK